MATGGVLISALVSIGVMLGWSHHETEADADAACTYAARRGDLLKQVDGAKQLLAAQRTGNLSLRRYGSIWYPLAPGGIGDAQRCDDSGPLGWLRPGSTPCTVVNTQ